MRFSKAFTVSLVLTTIFAGTLAAEAASFGRDPGSAGIIGPGLFGLKTLLELNLSDSQKSQVLSIYGKYENDIKSAMNSLMEARKNLHTALQAPEFNEDGIRNAYDQVAQFGEELLVMGAKMMAELKTVLTPEQLQLLKKIKAQRIEWLKGRLDRWLEKQND